MYDLGLYFKPEIYRWDAHYSASAEKLLVEAYHDVFVFRCEVDDFIVSYPRSHLPCCPTEISKIFVQPEQLFVEKDCGSLQNTCASLW